MGRGKKRKRSPSDSAESDSEALPVASDRAKPVLDCFFMVSRRLPSEAPDAVHAAMEEGASGPVHRVVPVDGFPPMMVAGLAFVLLGAPLPDDPHHVLRFIDPKEPVHRPDLGEEFSDEVLEALGVDDSIDGWDSRW